REPGGQPQPPGLTDIEHTGDMTMNQEMKKTLAFVLAAFLMTGAALFARVDRSIKPEAFNDQGQKFFDDFDPNTCTTLEVIDFDSATASVLPFKVTFKDGKW